MAFLSMRQQVQALQARVAQLEQENRSLRLDLKTCQRSQASQSQVAELERAYAVLQAQLRERDHCEQELQEQLAVACEQEKAAQERMAELANANEALRRGVERLTEVGNIDALLDSFLLEVMTATGASAGAVFDRVLGTEFQMRSLAQDGVINRTFDSHALDWALKEVTTRDPVGVFRQLAEGQVYCHEVDDYFASWFPEAAVYHRQQGHQVCWNFPFRVGKQVAGYLAIAFREKRLPNQIITETVQALTHLVSLALETLRLAEEAKQAAIAREQEKAAQERAAELAKANEALARTAVRLTELGDLTRFFDELLLETSQQLQADSAHLVVYDNKQRRYNSLHQYNGKVKSEPELPASFSLDEMQPENFHTIAQRERRPHWYDPQADAALFSPGAGAFLSRAGLRSLLHVPLIVGEQIVGGIGFAFREPHPEGGQRQVLVEALAHQVALAIQLIQLAEEAKQAAITREQEKAAQERVAELVKANEALRGTTDRLANEPSLNTFLGHVISEACRQVDCDAGAIFLYDETLEQLSLTVGIGIEAYPDSKQILLPTADYPGWSILLETRKPLFFHPDVNPEMYGKGTLEWHRAQGHHGILATALMLGDRPLGQIVVAFRHKHNFKETDLELFQALAQQATLAVQLMHLAEEAKQAAIAREQEKAAQERAAELAKANDALRRSVDRMTSDSRLETLLSSFLTEAVETVGADAAAVMLRVSGSLKFTPAAVVEDGRLLSPEELAVDPYLSGYVEFSSNDVDGIFSTLACGETPSIRVDDLREVFPAAYTYHQRRGHRIIWHAPLRLHSELIGFTGIALHEDRLPSNAVRETVAALAQQLTLALELTRLAEEAKQAAIAREHEKAATERAAKLAQANEVLRASAESLTSAEDLDSFLGHVLLAITKQLGARSSTVWLNDCAARLAYLKFVVEDGVVVPAAQSNHPNAHKPTILLPDELMPGNLTGKAQPAINKIASHPRLTNEQKQYFENLGVKAFLVAPMVLSDEHLGSFTIRLEDDCPLLEEDLELIQALANQATLAVQLTRLAEEAKQKAEQSAILTERNRIAGEIHDTLAQSFTGISLNLNVAHKIMTQRPETAREMLKHVIELAKQGLIEARRSVWALSPGGAEYSDLKSVLACNIKQITSGTAARVEMHVQGTPRLVPNYIGLNILRIGQEALTNALRYAQAKTIWLELTFAPESVQLGVRDNGRGFDLKQADSGGFGLMGMRQRAERIGGELSIASQPGQGTEIVIWVAV
ncbi:MAG TPA: GAF domain-containing protein [Coleofasciculaceae cyanobacterium]